MCRKAHADTCISRTLVVMKVSIERIKFFVLAGLLFVLPLSKAMLSLFMVAFCVVGLVNGRSLIRRLPQLSRLFWLPVAYFLWHLIGMLWSSNYAFGWQDLNTKLPFVLFPLLLLSYEHVLKEREAQWQRTFIAGLSLALTYCLVLAISRYVHSGEISEFFYTSFSQLVHPSYFAWFIDLAMVFLILDTHQNYVFKKSSFWIIVICFSAGVLLLNSKAGIIGWLLAVVLAFAWNAFRSRSWRPLLTATFWSICFLIALKFLIPTSVNRMETMRRVVAEKKDNMAEAESSSTRLQIWEQAIRLIRDQPLLGTGTGDVKDVLVAAYEDADMQFAASRRFNAHNQFLQSWLTLGVLGALIFLSLIIFPLMIAFRMRDPYLFTFIALAAFNMLVESMLEKQSGAVFFSLFYSVFLWKIDNRKRIPVS